MTTDAEIRKLMHAELKVCHEDFEAMRTHCASAEAALAERDKPCVWRLRIDGEIGPGCSGGRSIQIGSWKFCPYCGHPVEVTE